MGRNEAIADIHGYVCHYLLGLCKLAGTMKMDSQGPRVAKRLRLKHWKDKGPTRLRNFQCLNNGKRKAYVKEEKTKA